MLYCSRGKSLPPEKFSVALVQMSCGPEPEQNLEKALERIADAAGAARKSSAHPNFFRRSISASAKTMRCSIWQSRFPDPRRRSCADAARKT